jgi:O-antigen/teichoic acid export membrane protein
LRKYLMKPERSLLQDGTWIAGLQVLAALGQLIGIRVLTEILPLQVFGEFNLWLGAVALVASGLANPTMQALLRYYPEYAALGKGELVKVTAENQIKKLIVWMLPVLLLGALYYINTDRGDKLILPLLAALLTIEVMRMQGFALLNATKTHKYYAIWAVAEAWLRPLFAWQLVTQFSANTVIVLFGYFLASIFNLYLMRRFIPHDDKASTSLDERTLLAKRVWQYSLPLLPLGVIGWLSGMADRYMIGALLSPSQAGLYIAIYGLASRPMLMLGSVVETIIRPAYYSALASKDVNKANNHLRKWFFIAALCSGIAVLGTWKGHSWIARIVLADEYRSASFMLPWIVVGYSLLILSHIASRVCYANEATKSVLVIETSSAVLAVTIGYLMIDRSGIVGAAQAAPLYYGAQLIIAYLFAKKWFTNTQQLTD